MAFELLNTDLDVPHGYYHDLESVFYVLCYVCCTSAGPNGFTREDFDLARSDLQYWFPQMGRAIVFRAFVKEKMVGDEVQFETGILGPFGQYFDIAALKEHMQELRHLLFPPKMTDIARRMYEERGEPLPLVYCPCSDLEPSYVFGAYKKNLRRMYDSVEEPEAPMMTAPDDEPVISALARSGEELSLRFVDFQGVVEDAQLGEAASDALSQDGLGEDASPSRTISPTAPTTDPISATRTESMSTLGRKRKAFAWNYDLVGDSASHVKRSRTMHYIVAERTARSDPHVEADTNAAVMMDVDDPSPSPVPLRPTKAR